ncbi:MAG: hypothetical protein KGL39_37665 [Patescibacteria group bacterium]|nr:hypothetical protein [Patescibacteria group bacterium]
MQVHQQRIVSEVGKPYRLFLMSDLHLGSAYVDKKKISEDLKSAAKADADILVNGDVFDAINPKDKRYMPSCYDKSLLGKDDVGEAMVDIAFEIFSPHANRIKVIGIGNHEESWIRRSAEDLVGRLIGKLNSKLENENHTNRIRHGGISGFFRTTFEFPRPKGTTFSSVSHTLLYQHGAGGDSPVTKGAIDFYRKGNQYDYDCVTMGHRHNRTFGCDNITYLSRGGYIVNRERLYVQTASYLMNIVQTDQKNPLNYSYAESGHHAPKPLGGMFLTITPTRETRKEGDAHSSLYRVKQEVATAV